MTSRQVSPSTPGREVFAWAMYDWANSAYSTLQITVLVKYMIASVDRLVPEAGALVWGWGIGLTMFVAALLSPVIGALADAHASKRKWLAGTALTGAVASSLMFFATPDRTWLLVPLFLVANLSFELSLCVYNGFLPEIAREDNMGRVSAYGFALGYLGGGLALVLALALFFFGHRLGLPPADDDPQALLPRLGLLSMGLWWGVFTLPAVFWLKDRKPPPDRPQPLLPAARAALAKVAHTLRNVRQYRALAIFLVAFLLYNDGVQTVISQASVFADKVLRMETSELVMVILMIQFAAMPGAWLVGRLADRFGQKRTLSLCLAVWTALLIAAFFVRTNVHFWCMAAVVALVLGGTQSVSRAIMGLMTPVERTAEFFGFFNLSGKATSVFGPVFFSTILYTTGSAHWALTSLLLFFVLGWTLICFVHVAPDAGKREPSHTGGCQERAGLDPLPRRC
jgi:UMF1 family MFS transporter